MHRLLADTALLGSESPSLPRDAERHLKVLRVKPGEKVELFDGSGRTRLYSVSGTGSLLAAAPAVDHPRRTGGVTLFACVTKGSRWDWTVEKATELGVTRIVPVISDRTIVRIAKGERAAKRARWTRIAEDAARQSDAKWIPDILEPVDFSASLALVAETDCLVGALTDPPSPPIAGAGGNAVYIGPEVDFTPDELSALVKVARPVSLGPTILRAETAAIFAVSVLAASMQR
jgi:16S rRNA (uracil1498-N3)-methyltransferase